MVRYSAKGDHWRPKNAPMLHVCWQGRFCSLGIYLIPSILLVGLALRSFRYGQDTWYMVHTIRIIWLWLYDGFYNLCYRVTDTSRLWQMHTYEVEYWFSQSNNSLEVSIVLFSSVINTLGFIKCIYVYKSLAHSNIVAFCWITFCCIGQLQYYPSITYCLDVLWLLILFLYTYFIPNLPNCVKWSQGLFTFIYSQWRNNHNEETITICFPCSSNHKRRCLTNICMKTTCISGFACWTSARHRNNFTFLCTLPAKVLHVTQSICTWYCCTVTCTDVFVFFCSCHFRHSCSPLPLHCC